MEHSNVMGGSSAYQRINCPGSYQLEQDMPKQPESEFATRGSMLHAAMELLITADPADLKAAEPLFEELIGQDLGFGEDHEITQELIETKLRPAMAAWFLIRKRYGLEDWFIEQRVSLQTIVPGAFGTADIIAIDIAGRLHIIDWKFGDGVPVPVEGNYGLGFYAGGALYDEDPELIEFCENINGVVLSIVQPRVGTDEADVLDSWEASEDWVEELVTLAANAIDQAMKPDAPTKTGDWCRWCRAKTVCPAFNAIASQAISKEPQSMTSVELAAALKMATQLKPWIADVWKLAQHEMEQGATVPGFKLVNKRPRRVWAEADKVEAICKKKRIKVGDMYKRELLSPAQMETKNKKVYSTALSEYAVMHSSGLTVVEESDKRVAVTSSMDLLANALPNQETGKRKQENE